MKSLQISPLILTLILLAATFGLAVPSINVNVQEIGAGAGFISSPVSTGTVCVPYAYYYYISGIGWLGPYYLNSISEVYPGNFTLDLYTGTNVSVAVYDSSSVVSTGVVTLQSTLPAGYYTRVEINPPISYAQALGGEFHVLLQPPNSTVLNLGSISLAVQELGMGYPDGSYGDYLVLYYDGGLYRIYVVVRCYGLMFAPSTYSRRAGTLSGNLVRGGRLNKGRKEILPDLFNTRKEPIHLENYGLSNLPQLLNESPYLKSVLPEAVEEITGAGGG